jgi:peptidoglycan/LPS O-acetylase OafA/YrhL
MPGDVQLATQQRLARVSEIDLLRFFAVMMVVLFHYAFRGYAANDMSVMPYPALAGMAKYGYLGVDLFFVISGFVILMTASSGSLRQFSISRIVRLYPAFWFCCTVTFIATLAFGGTHFSATLGQYLVNMTMLNEFIGVKSIDQVYWSLAIELQFYVMVGLLLMCRQIPRSQFFLLAWLVAVIAAKVFPVGWALSALLIADYGAYFIAGATCFLVYSRGATPTRLAMIAIAWVTASFGAVQTIPRLEAKLHSVFDPYVVASLIAVFFAAIFLVSMRWTAALSRYEWITLGALTYPLYLLHQNLGYMIFNIAYPALNPHLLIWGTIFLMLLCAFLVHKLIEKDFARFLKRILNKALATVFKRQTLRRQRDGSSG